jgi:transcriptional antiterminator RfaH
MKDRQHIAAGPLHTGGTLPPHACEPNPLRVWHLVVCKPRQEAIAEQHLQRQGYATYLPRIQARRHRRGAWQDGSEPLFPRYLFIHVAAGRQSTAPIRSTRGALGLVRFGVDLARVPDAVITTLRALEDARTWLRLDQSRALVPGEAVTVREGPLAGLAGVVACEDSTQRVVLLLELLGRANRVTRKKWPSGRSGLTTKNSRNWPSHCPRASTASICSD